MWHASDEFIQIIFLLNWIALVKFVKERRAPHLLCGSNS